MIDDRGFSGSVLRRYRTIRRDDPTMRLPPIETRLANQYPASTARHLLLAETLQA